MTVAELIAILSTWPPKARVVVDGYEGGYDDPHVSACLMVPGTAGNCCGMHDSVFMDDYTAAPPRTVPAVVVSRDETDECYNFASLDEALDAMTRQPKPRPPLPTQAPPPEDLLPTMWEHGPVIDGETGIERYRWAAWGRMAAALWVNGALPEDATIAAYAGQVVGITVSWRVHEGRGTEVCGYIGEHTCESNEAAALLLYEGFMRPCLMVQDDADERARVESVAQLRRVLGRAET